MLRPTEPGLTRCGILFAWKVKPTQLIDIDLLHFLEEDWSGFERCIMVLQLRVMSLCMQHGWKIDWRIKLHPVCFARGIIHPVRKLVFVQVCLYSQ